MSSSATSSLCIELPEWVELTVQSWNEPLGTDPERMRLAIALSRINVDRGGGPFAALVFAGDEWLGAGVNRVVDSGFSIAHAEIIGLMAAQQRRRHRSAELASPLTLITTTEPCCQCFGALVWAGVQKLVCGATTADAEAIGFDEGPKPANWIGALVERGIGVVRETCRREAALVLEYYARQGGELYGAKSPVRVREQPL